MKRKLAILFVAAVSCACFTAGLAACGDGGESGSEHNMTYHAAAAATCTTDGNSAYYYCGDCGKYFSDANGTTEIDLSSTVIAATGHNYEVDFSWTGTTKATATQYCAVCNAEGDTVDAQIELTSETAATCTEDGALVYTATATFDGETFTDTKTIVDPATGHTYSEEWSSDDDYHWHVAICEHTDEVSDKESHTYEKDPNTGSYVCAVCGHEMYSTGGGTSGADITLAIGANYITLGATSTSDDGVENDSSYITGVTFTATESGTYTLSIPTDCQALLYVYDSYDTLYRIGYSGYSDSAYSATFDLSAGESLNIDTIRPAEGVTLENEYVFCLTIAYESKDISVTGSESNPYAFSHPGYTSDGAYTGSADSTEVTLEAGASYYFTVSYDSEILSRVYFSKSDASSFELYVDGTKVDYGTYYFSSGATTKTFCLKNVSSGELTNTIYCNAYQPSLSTSSNTVEVTSAMLNSSNSITYYFTVAASTSYTITLGSGTDSNVAVYYNGQRSSNSMTGSESTLILGNGASSSSYIVTNTRTNYPQSYLLTLTYTGATIPDSFTAYINFEKYEEPEEDDSDITYTAINLNEAFSMNFSAASSYYYSYTPTDSGNLTIVLTFTNTAFYSTLVSLITVKVNDTAISGSAESDGVYFVIAGGASEYKINITMSGATLTLTGTLTSGGESSGETTLEALSIGNNDVVEYTTYSFTATEAGTYKFTVSGTKGYGQLYESDSSFSALLDESEGSTSYSVELTAGQTITIYVSNGGDGDFVVNIAKS